MIQFKWDKKSEWLLGGFEYLRADDLVAGAAVGTGPTFRTDQLAGGQHVPFAKLMSGTADDAAVIPGDATNGLFVQVKTSALPSGAATEATLAAASAKLPATLGQKAMVASMAVALASDQGALPITDNSGTLTVDSPQLAATLGQKAMAASNAVVIASDQSAVPMSAASLPLPTGASTVAKQPSLGTAGTPSADVITVQGAALMTALKVDGSAVTQPVSAASLPLPTGAAAETTLAAASAKLPATLGQKAMVASMSVAIASDQGVLPINDNGGSLTIDAVSLPLPTGASTETTLAAASAKLPATLGQKAMAASLAVALASDQASIPVAATLGAETTKVIGTVNVAAAQTIAVTNAGAFAVQDSEKVADNAGFTDGTTKVLPAGFIFDEVAGTALTENDAGAARMDSKRAQVLVLEDATTRGQRQAVNAGGAAEVQGDVAHNVAISGNPVRMAGRAGNADYTAVTNGATADILTDLNGKQIVLPYAVPENFVSGAISAAMTGTTSTSLVAAPGAGLRNYITTIIVSNSHATVGTDIVIQDGSGGTTLMTIPAGAIYGGAVISLPTPLRQPTANTALFCANVTTGASTKVSAVGYKAP